MPRISIYTSKENAWISISLQIINSLIITKFMWRPTSLGNEDVLICINAQFMTQRVLKPWWRWTYQNFAVKRASARAVTGKVTSWEVWFREPKMDNIVSWGVGRYNFYLKNLNQQPIAYITSKFADPNILLGIIYHYSYQSFRNVNLKIPEWSIIHTSKYCSSLHEFITFPQSHLINLIKDVRGNNMFL
jgi:hypothetical protein